MHSVCKKHMGGKPGTGSDKDCLTDGTQEKGLVARDVCGLRIQLCVLAGSQECDFVWSKRQREDESMGLGNWLGTNSYNPPIVMLTGCFGPRVGTHGPVLNFELKQCFFQARYGLMRKIPQMRHKNSGLICRKAKV